MLICCCYIVLFVVLLLCFIGIDGFSEIDVGWLMFVIFVLMLVVLFVVVMFMCWLLVGVILGFGLLVVVVGFVWFDIVLCGGVGLVVIVLMFVIGVGVGMLWGLMDGLLVSVVLKECVGMVMGIFSMMCVVGEGIVLVIVGVVLVVFV